MSVMPSDAATRRRMEIEPSLSKGWRWLLVLGVVQLAAGMTAVVLPTAAAIAAALVIGWLLVIAAFFQLIHAFTVHRWCGFGLHLLSAILYGIAGMVLLAWPLQGAAGLAFVVAALLLADAVVHAALAWRVRPRDGWLWLLAGGIVSFILGAAIVLGWPATAVWTLGVMLGVQFTVVGLMHVGLALACRARARSVSRR